VRGANGYPKQIKSSTNPGGVGHVWVKERFVSPSPHGRAFLGEDGLSRIFIPSLLEDNRFLCVQDPSYRERLSALPEKEKRALLFGDWDIFDGQYFSEFDGARHVIPAFEIPAEWRKYRTIDYGLDRLACLWIAISPEGTAYVYREYCESDLTISAAARAIIERTPRGESIYATLAPPDLWSRGQETGKSKASLFCEGGVALTKTSNDRECGWLAIKELLSPAGRMQIRFFESCREIIKCLPALTVDRTRPTDCSTEPHAITHAPDALRGFAIFYARPTERSDSRRHSPWTADMWEDYMRADEEEKNYLRRRYGEPN